MKRLIGIGLVAAAFAHTPQAWADPGTNIPAFLAAVQQDGINGPSGTLIQNGVWVCQQFAHTNLIGTQLATMLAANNPNMDQQHALSFVIDAELYLCPQTVAGR